MSSLSSILPLTETVVVRGLDIEVPGCSVKELGRALFRFPQLATVFQDAHMAKIGSAILDAGDDVANVIIAAGLRVSGNQDEEAGIANLALGEKATLIAAILRVSLPDGPRPLLDLLAALKVEVPAASINETSAKPSPPPASA